LKSKEKVSWFIFLVFLLALDFFTKRWAIDTIAPCQIYEQTYPYGGIGIFQGWLQGIDFSLGYVENKGAAFGILSSYSKMLFILRSGLILILAIWFFFLEKKHKNRFAWILILSGAIGNWIDMFLYSAVIDFLNFHIYGYSFPLFNLADAFITSGAIIVVVKELFFRKHPN